MIKSELVYRLSNANPRLYQRDLENVLNAVLNQITDAMKRAIESSSVVLELFQ